MQMLRPKSLKSRMNIILLSLVLVSITLVTVIASYHVRNQWILENQTRINQQIQLMNQEIQLFIQDISENTKMISEFPTIRQVDDRITSYVDLESADGYIDMIPGRNNDFELEVFEILRIFQENHDSVMNASVGVEINGGFLKSPPSKRFNGYDARARSWYQIAMANPDHVTIPGIYTTSSNEQVILCVTTIRNFEEDLVGVVTVDFDLEYLSIILSELKVSQHGFAFITDKRGNIIAHPKGADYIGQNLAAIGYGDFLVEDQVVESIHRLVADDIEYQIQAIPAELDKIDLFYFVALDRKRYESNINGLIRNLVVSAMIMTIIVSITSRILTNRLSKPLIALSNFTDNLAEGDLSQRLPIERRDEIGRLGERFNSMAQALEKSRNTLEDQVEIRTQELTSANRDLINLNEELTNTLSLLKDTQSQLIQSEKLAAVGTMVTGIAHELNTPLGTAITTMSYMTSHLEEFSKKYSNHDLSKSYVSNYIHNMKEASHLLSRVLNESVSLIDEFKAIPTDLNEERLEQVQMKRLLDEVIATYGDIIAREAYDIKIQCPDNLYTMIYGNAFKNMLKHLIENTMHHAYDDSARKIIEISVRTEQDLVLMEFVDYGKGINANDAHRIFEPFYTSNRYDGALGLGLNIVYNTITYLLRGSITLDGSSKTGLKYIIKWPK